MKEIIELRKHFSAIKLAERLGVTRAMIYYYLEGKHDPSLKVYKRIIKELELNNINNQ